MKKILSLILIGLLFTRIAYGAISWTKSWSSSDDGSAFSGSDIQNIQSDVSNQSPTLSATQTFTGTNTFSGTTTFTGTVTGLGGSKDGIARGFELVWASTTTITVNPGTLYHGTTQVDTTATTTLTISTASDYVTGVSERGTSKWLYVYVNNVGTAKLDDTAPDYADTNGNTAGTKYYYLYSATYYRCIGAIYLNATGSGEVNNFYQRNNIVMLDVPVNITTTLSAGAWSGATSCTTGMPSISTLAIFGLQIQESDASTNWRVFIRPNGSTWATDASNGLAGGPSASNVTEGTQRICATDSSQQIQYYNNAGDESLRIDVEGFAYNIR